VNIVILNDAASIRGGADRIAFDSARGLAAAGHRVTLFTAFGPVDPSLHNVPNLTVLCLGTGWLREQQASPRAALTGLWNRAAARRLREVLAGFDRRDTIVHAHLYSSALTASVLSAAVAAGFTTVLSLHDYFITCPNGAYFEFPRAQLCERRALSASCLACHCDSRRRVHKAWRVARTWLQNRVARVPQRLAGYAAVSQTCATLARRDLPATARITVVPNIVAVDPQPPVPAAQNRPLVFTGRLEAYKGPQLLAAAAARLALPVVFCGSGPLEPELRRLYPAARFTGWLPPEGVLAELQGARAFVFPSVYRETFGLSAAEALARGIPVVASRGTAAEEFVHHDRNGLLFAHHSVDDLTAQLRLLADDRTVRRLGDTAYADYWAAPLTLGNHLRHLERFYADVMSAAGHVPAPGRPAPADLVS
jgi:glycosyltransferase involved in cell wall biosynthesis